MILHEMIMFEISSSEELDSDQIDSDLEAELYSSLHHEVIPVDSDNNATLSKETRSNKPLPAEDIITIISEDEGDDVIPINFSNQSGLISLSSASSSFSNTTPSPSKKKCKVTNMRINNGNADGKKSNVVANLLENIQVLTPTEIKKQQNPNLKSANSLGNSTIILSDSEDSKDLSDLEGAEPQFLHTNISKRSALNDSVTFLGIREKKGLVADTISLKSDSDDDSMFDFRFETNVDSTNSSKDLWHINDTDLYRSKRKSGGRYHEDAVTQCTNCSRKGHTARNCVEPKALKCAICGGDHNHFRCKQRMCSKCLRFHSNTYCLAPVDQFVCTICNMRGHLKKVCPDLWRRYHLTTSGEKIRQAKRSRQDTPIYCFNCGAQGHFGFQCNRKRMEDSYPTLSAVVSYQHPLESLMHNVEEGMLRNTAKRRNEHTESSSVPLNEVAQPKNGRAPKKTAPKKVSLKKLERQQLILQKKVERRVAKIKNGTYTEEMHRTKLKTQLHSIQEKLQNTPIDNKRLRKRLKRKIKTKSRLLCVNKRIAQ